MQVTVHYDDDANSAEVEIATEEDFQFAHLMCAAEYLCAVAAQESNAGYEKACELIIQGAMTYKNKFATDSKLE